MMVGWKMKYKRAESVLVVIYHHPTKQVLMLKHKDDSDFWQSVTGSIEEGESPLDAAKREVEEELGSFISTESLVDCNKSVRFEIFPQFLTRYPPGTTHSHEYWFLLPLADKPKLFLTEHDDYQWLDAKSASLLTKSWNNAQAIEEFILELDN